MCGHKNHHVVGFLEISIHLTVYVFPRKSDDISKVSSCTSDPVRKLFNLRDILKNDKQIPSMLITF